MQRLRLIAISGGLALLAGACGSGDGGEGEGAGDAGGGDGGGEGGADAAITGDFETLATGDWELGNGDEDYYCVRKTLQEDTYVGGFEAIAPLGTHHTVVTVGSPSGPDGVEPCDTGENHNRMIFGSGVGTNPIHFPDGVAMKIDAGQQVLINLHVFNAGSGDLSGTSGTRILRVNPADVEHEAEAILMGDMNLEIEQGEQTETGYCSMDGAVNLFAVGPHMHQLGTHMTVTAESSAMGDTVIHDQEYNFDNQVLQLVDPLVAMEAGDQVVVECTYFNPNQTPVSWGESSNAEMCFATVYRYPATGRNFLCASYN